MFRLSRVLEWKERLEKAARFDRIAVERAADELEERARQLAATRRALPGDFDTIPRLAEWSRYGETLRRREAEARERLEALRPELAQKIRAHQELRIEVKGLLKLREREMSTKRKVRERRVQEMIDDAAARRKLPEPGKQFRGATLRSFEPIRGDDAQNPQEAGQGPERGTWT